MSYYDVDNVIIPHGGLSVCMIFMGIHVMLHGQFEYRVAGQLTPLLPGPHISFFKQISDPMNSKMFCGRCLVSLIITF